jgi:transposase
MQVLYERCCGLDVHKKTVVACVLITLPNGQVQKLVRTFATTTAGLLALADWLASVQVSHVAMESTGVFCRPVFNLLEEGHTIILVTAQQRKAVPGGKTDVQDSEWLADLLRHGLLKARCIPAKPTRGSLRHKIPQLQEALEGRGEAHHRVLLQSLLGHVAFVEDSIQHLHRELEQLLGPFEEALRLLLSIPGIQAIAAEAILAEMGTALSRFASAKHLASWAGVCPGNKLSAGKRLGGKTTKGNARLRAVLAEVVWTLSHMKDHYLSAQSHRLARRLGKQKAVMAVAHSVLVIIYSVLRDKKPYSDLGVDYFDTLEKERLTRQSIRRLEALGYTVTLTPNQQEESA